MSKSGFIHKVLCPVVLVLFVIVPLCSGENLIINPGFEDVEDEHPVGWSDLWIREAGAGQVGLDQQVVHSGNTALKNQHSGERDWSISNGPSRNVSAGDQYVFSGWALFEGSGSSELCVITYDKEGDVLEWSYGSARVHNNNTWQRVESQFIIPRNITKIQPRIIGSGIGTVRWDDITLIKQGNVFEQYGQQPMQSYTLSNSLLSLTFDTQTFVLSVEDKRSGYKWLQSTLPDHYFLLNIKRDDGLNMTLLDGASEQQFNALIQLEPEKPEFTVTISGEGTLNQALQFPPYFIGEQGMHLVIPINEGISAPIEDTSFDTMTLVAYGGHGICMAFWGMTDGHNGHMAIIETPDDAAIRIQRHDGLLNIQPEWHTQMGKFGYPRRLRYVFFNNGDHVAMCKRYREYVQAIGKFKSLREKQQINSHVDRLIGAVNVWNWDSDPVEMIDIMKGLGIDHILWSRRCSPEAIAAMNDMNGVLTSRYDIYQDLMDPNIVETKLWQAHSDWTQAGWPNDLMLGPGGDWRKGWQVKGRDGNMYPCGVLCDKQALKFAQERVPAELETHAYHCRFIDTTTASPWRECYDPRHLMTRSDSRFWKMELLRYMSETLNLVTGSETGHDAAVPYVHFFEGMMSLGPYRVPDAGRNMIQLWDVVPERVEKYQLGHSYRLPLWELVYHDCVVSYWYWGDYNNKLPSLWDKRDLFNILYATPPMFMFNKDIWTQYKDRFVLSYKAICPIVRRMGYARMLNHKFLTSNRDVQQTTFSNGVTITVNFGEIPYTLSDGSILKSMEYKVSPN